MTLAILSSLVLAGTFVLGLNIGDATLRDRAVQQTVSRHMLLGLAALVSAVLVHAVVLTYFMGTGRWLEETSRAYHLPDTWLRENRSLKYRTLPLMTVCLFLLIAAGALGGASDPASSVGFREWQGIPAGTWHMLFALCTWGFNLAVNLWEYAALERNGSLIAAVLGEVRRMRLERGLEV